jgi:uridine kinase
MNLKYNEIMKPLLICVAGGSASGKSTVVEKIVLKAGLKEVLIIKHDDYYKDTPTLSLSDRKKINYDHPESLDNDLLIHHLEALLAGTSVEKPIYDFVEFKRLENTESLVPKKVIILEGILILDDPRIRTLSDLSIFVELDDDTRFIRRLQRDFQERGRSVESIIDQYLTTVKPMFHQFVRPTKRYADVIIPNDINHDTAVDLIASKVIQFLIDKK